MDIPRLLDTKTWDCPICQDVMDGDHGNVSISKRCFHVFHDTCIRKWVDEQKGTCPLCNLPNFCNVEILSNPSFTQQYKLWKANPDTYIFDAELLKPEELRGLKWRAEFTRPELEAYRDEIGRQIDALGIDDSLEKVRKLQAEYDMVKQLLLKDIKEGFIEIKEDFNKTNDHLDTNDLLKHFSQKLEAIDERAEAKIKQLELKYPIDCSLVGKLRDFTVELSKYNQKFSDAAQTNYTNPDNPSPEEARQRLRNVDAQMEAFIDSQTEAIKSVLRKPLPVPQLPIIHEEPPIQPTPWKLKPIFKIMIIAASIFAIYAMVRSGRAKNTFQKPQLPKSNF